MSLYMFENDKIRSGFRENKFNITCYGECPEKWPPLLVDDIHKTQTVGKGLDEKLIGNKKRRDGKYQVTYFNIPLYHYYLDKKPGDTLGNNQFGSGGMWYLINSSGRQLAINMP